MPDAAIGSARAGRPANPAMWIGATILTGFALLAIFGERIAPYDPTAQDLLAIMEAPSAAHLLGADAVGRDILSRIMSGTRYTLSVALASVFLAGIGGSHSARSRVISAAPSTASSLRSSISLTVPNLVFAIAIAAAVGASATGLTIASR